MQLYEITNETAKIIYNPAENYILPADFILIEDTYQKIITQVISIETTSEFDNIATVKPALSIDNRDKLSYYNGYIPSRDAKIMYINCDEISELVQGSGESIFLGNLANKTDCYINTSVSFVDDKLCIFSDNSDKTAIIIENIVKQLSEKNKKIILADFDGRYSFLNNAYKLKLSENFKLPLNISAFDTISEYDTTDCPPEDKVFIQGIVLELRNYLKTLENPYLPFGLFKDTIDAEYKSNPTQGLLLLRNKILRYSQDDLFAEKQDEFDVFDKIFETENIIVADASATEPKWFKHIIKTVTELTDQSVYLIFSLNDVNADKKLLSGLYNNPKIKPVIICSYTDKHRQLLSSWAENNIFTKPHKPVLIEENYPALLNKLNNDEFIICGEATLFLPLLLNYRAFDKSEGDDILSQKIGTDNDKDKFYMDSDDVISSENLNEDHIEEEGNKNNNIPDTDFTDEDLDFLDQISKFENNINEVANSGKEKEPEVESQEIVYDAKEYREEPEDEDPEEKDEEEFEEETVKDEDLEEDEEEFEEEIIDDEDLEEGEEEFEEEIIKDEDPEEEGEEEFEEEIIEVDDPEEDSEEEFEEEIIEDEDPEEEGEEEFEEEIIEDEDPEEDDDEEEDQLLTDDQANYEMFVPIDSTSEENTVDSDEEDEDSGESELTEQPSSEEENTDPEINKITDDHTVETASLVVESVINDIKEKAKSNIPSYQPVEQKINKDDFYEDYEEEPEEEPEEEAPPVKKNINTYEVPELTVYETETSSKAESGELPFQKGDKVYHPKHGYGIIEGFANYSNKIIFCQVDFENAGKRILDPRISDLKKV